MNSRIYWNCFGIYSQNQDYIYAVIDYLNIEPASRFRNAEWNDYWKIEPTSRSKNTANGFKVQKHFDIDLLNDLRVHYSNYKFLIALIKRLAGSIFK